MYERILIAVDGSAASNRALREGLALARNQQAAVRVIHVVEATPIVTGDAYVDFEAFRAARVNEGRVVLDHVAATLTDDPIGVDLELVEVQERPLGEAIIADASHWHADLIVLGTHGRGGLVHLLLGSVAEAVIRHTQLPVLLVRAV
jgi:nucleotide-binding universal stress UspA family protein